MKFLDNRIWNYAVCVVIFELVTLTYKRLPMIEMKSAEHKDCFTIALFSPPPLHGATESLKKRKKAWSNRLYTPPGGVL